MNNAFKSLIGIVVVLLISFILVGLFVPQFNYYSQVVVNKPAQVAYQVFMDESQLKQWLTGLESVELIEGKKNTVGSRYKMVIVENGERFEATQEILKIKPNAEFAFRLDGDALSNSVRVRFVQRGDNETAIVQSNRVRGNNVFWRSLLFLSKSQLEAKEQESYMRLKSLIEKS